MVWRKVGSEKQNVQYALPYRASDGRQLANKLYMAHVGIGGERLLGSAELASIPAQLGGIRRASS